MKLFLLLLVAGLVGLRLLARLMTGHQREIQRRFKEGCCMNCGYDIRVNPNGRCPECGKFM
jgi:hypothetical protein